MNKFTLEVMVGEIESLQAAIAGGADRIELCSHPAGGGLTPSPGYFHEVRKTTVKPIFVLIRPHTGGFVYSKEEISCIEQDISYFKTQGADGIVCGFLTDSYKVDYELTKHFVELSKPLPFTFHRAIDDCTNIIEGIETALKAGSKRILTSGGKSNAAQGIHTIEKAIQHFGNEVVIMPGSGVNAQNIHQFIDIGATEFHSSAGKHIVSPEQFPEPLFHRKQRKVTDIESVKAIKAILEKSKV